MKKRAKKEKVNTSVCTAEQAIIDANWDKQSTWVTLAGQKESATWKEQELAGAK